MDAARRLLHDAVWKSFSVADHLNRHNADRAWEPTKNLGNAALKRGEYLTASKLYHKAALLAMGPLEGGVYDAFIQALETWPEGSAHRRLVETEDLLWERVLLQLPAPPPARVMELPDGGGEFSAAYPNSAQRAIDADPEYVKAHYRKQKALEALGREAEADRVRTEISEYERVRGMFQAEALALLSVGWISWERCATG